MPVISQLLFDCTFFALQSIANKINQQITEIKIPYALLSLALFSHQTKIKNHLNAELNAKSSNLR